MVILEEYVNIRMGLLLIDHQLISNSAQFFLNLL